MIMDEQKSGDSVPMYIIYRRERQRGRDKGVLMMRWEFGDE
jgi:hypothetical protein